MVHSTTTLAPSTSSCDAGYTTVGSKCYKVVTSSANYLQVGFSNSYDIDIMIKCSENAPTFTFSLLQESTMRFQQGKGTIV